MKIRIETSSLATPHQSGVSSYTQLLIDNLAAKDTVNTYAHYFNFLKKQPSPNFPENIHIEENSVVPLRLYAKAQSYNLSPPFDPFLSNVSVTIFPNFATWPTVRSTLRATTVHDLTYIYYPEYVEPRNLTHLRRVVPRTLKEADIILTVSNTVKDEIVKEFAVDSNKVLVTHIPPDSIFRNKLDAYELTEVQQKYKIGDKKYILFLGNFEPRKNLKGLIEAYRLLPKNIKDDYRLVLAGGKGWNSTKTQQALNEAIAAGEDIQHIGYIDSKDRPALYQAASLFAFPSLYEGFGIPILEAMLSGCPVVAADIPVLHETGGDSILYANPNNTTELSGTIQKALESYPYSVSKMQKNVNRFSWDANIDSFITKVNQLLEQK